MKTTLLTLFMFFLLSCSKNTKEEAINEKIFGEIPKLNEHRAKEKGE